jgi:hypothetical protein
MQGWSDLMKRFFIKACFYFFIIFANVAIAQFTTFEFPSFPTAVNFAKTDTAELVLSSRATISSSLQVPKTVSVRVQQGGRFNINSGKTLRFVGTFNAEPYQVFEGSGTVTFDSGAVRTVYPEWWGASSDLTGDSGPALQKAINACPNGGEVYLSGTSQGYLVATGRIRFPSNKTIYLRGNGTTINFSGSDTLFIINTGTSTSAPRHIIEGLKMSKVGTRGQAYAIVVNNSLFLTVQDCLIEFFHKAIELVNTGSTGFTEATTIRKTKILSCNNGIRFNKLGTVASFKTTRIEDVTISDTGQAVGDTIYGIWIGTGASVYASYINANIYPKDTTVAVYCNGTMRNTTGFIAIEVTGSTPQSGTKAFWFGSSAQNIECNIHADFTGVNLIGERVRVDGATPIQGIFTQMRGDTQQNRGISFIRNSSATLTRISSVVERDLATFDYTFDIRSDSTIVIGARRKHPIQLVDIENGYLMPFTGMWVGKRKTVTGTDTTEDVRDVSLLRLNKSSQVTLSNFINPTANQLLFVYHVNANTKIKNSSLIKLHEDLDFAPVASSFQTFMYDSLGSRWIEITRPSLPATTKTESSTTTTPNVAWISYLRLNYSSATTVTDFTGGRKGQILTVRHVTGNATIQHGSTIKLQGSTNFAGVFNATHQFVYDEVAGYWLEVSRITP